MDRIKNSKNFFFYHKESLRKFGGRVLLLFLVCSHVLSSEYCRQLGIPVQCSDAHKIHPLSPPKFYHIGGEGATKTGAGGPRFGVMLMVEAFINGMEAQATARSAKGGESNEAAL